MVPERLDGGAEVDSELEELWLPDWNDLTGDRRKAPPRLLRPETWDETQRALVSSVEDQVEAWFVAQDVAGHVKTSEELLICDGDEREAWVIVYGNYDHAYVEAIIDSPVLRMTRRHFNTLAILDYSWGEGFLPGTAVTSVILAADNPNGGWRLAGRIAAVTLLGVHADADERRSAPIERIHTTGTG